MSLGPEIPFNPSAREAADWLARNQWPTEGKSSKYASSVLVLSARSPDHEGFQFLSGSGPIEVEGYYDCHEQPRLINVSIRLVVPSWRKATLVSEKNVPLDETARFPITIGKISGEILLKIDDDIAGRVLTLEYEVQAPYGLLKGLSALFPADSKSLADSAAIFEGIETLDDSEVSRRRSAPFSVGRMHKNTSAEKYWELDDLGVEDEADSYGQLCRFLERYAEGNDKIIIANKPPPPRQLEVDSNIYHSSHTDALVADSKGGDYTLNVSFLDAYGLRGTINPDNLEIRSTLFLTVPLVGKVTLVNFQGSLISGIAESVDIYVAQGSVRLYAKPQGNEFPLCALFIDLSLSVKFIGSTNVDNFRIVDLPILKDAMELLNKGLYGS
ncbi:unnamed protein product [Rhizoctonia solani]|uniref:Uncharacterized protein n=1 Tax=Rhizoctonia solani TaxID=456999 RepID=A0A8H3B2L9_9AGAM|nr:unnamed protein product [Rhizoctonia solani]